MTETTNRPEDSVEPRLQELLDDPVVRQVMARDGVFREDVMAIISHVAVARAARANEDGEPALRQRAG